MIVQLRLWVYAGWKLKVQFGPALLQAVMAMRQLNAPHQFVGHELFQETKEKHPHLLS